MRTKKRQTAEENIEDEGSYADDTLQTHSSYIEISLLWILKMPILSLRQISSFSLQLPQHSELFLCSVWKNLSFKSIISLFSTSKAVSDTIF